MSTLKKQDFCKQYCRVCTAEHAKILKRQKSLIQRICFNLQAECEFSEQWALGLGIRVRQTNEL